MNPERQAESRPSFVDLVPPGGPRPAVRAERAREAPPAPRTAVFVVHGMGQQLRFETLDTVLAALRGAASRRGRELRAAVEMADLGGTPVPRAAIAAAESARHGTARAIHFYEAYWAPVTEGQVRLRDVLGFLLSAGLGGMRLATAKTGFERWMFGARQAFRIGAARTVGRFALAVWGVGSLFVLNALAVTVLLGNHLAGDALGGRAAAILPHLKLDVALFGAAFLQVAAGVAFGMLERRARPAAGERRGPGRVTLAAGAAGRALVSAGIAATLWGGAWAACDLWRLLAHMDPPHALRGAVAPLLAGHFALPPWTLLATLAAVLGLIALRRRPRALLVAGAVVILVNEALVLATLALLVAGGGALPAGIAPAARVAALWALAELWALAIAALPILRWFLIEFVGDVAAYISAHAVSRFDDIRTRIQSIAYGLARSIYQAESPDGPLYDEVVLVGHSLGSVIAYDTLNAMINEDEVLGRRWRVAERTRLLLTVASPLDKTAFIFRAQRPGETGVREGLAAVKQPLIQDYGFRPREWINIFSRADWIGGPLRYYDAASGAGAGAAGSEGPGRIRNDEDREAATPLAAHVEVFSGDLFGDTLYRELLGGEPPATAASR